LTDIDVRTVRVRPYGGRIAVALAGAVALVAVATWLILSGEGRWAGATAAGAGVLLVWAAVVVGREAWPRAAFAVAGMDLAFDGCLLSSIALVLRQADRPAAAAAAAALVLSFLAAYVRARGQSLGYPVEDSSATRALRYGLVSVGLVGDWPGPAMFALVGVNALTTAVRASQVAKQERE
jgi:hypothetical protein